MKDYLIWKTLEISPLPGWEGLTIHQRQTKVRKLIQEQQELAAEKRRSKNRTVVGVKQIMALDPRDRPKNPKTSGPQPLCHTADPEIEKAFEVKWREVKQHHAAASWDYRDGMHEREFPDGTFRPPIKTIFDSTRR